MLGSDGYIEKGNTSSVFNLAALKEWLFNHFELSYTALIPTYAILPSKGCSIDSTSFFLTRMGLYNAILFSLRTGTKLAPVIQIIPPSKNCI